MRYTVQFELANCISNMKHDETCINDFAGQMLGEVPEAFALRELLHFSPRKRHLSARWHGDFGTDILQSGKTAKN